MNWIKWPLVVVGFMYLFSRKWMTLPDLMKSDVKKSAPKKQAQPTDESPPAASPVEEAVRMGDLETMTAALSADMTYPEKEALLSTIVEEAYRLRKDPEMKQVFYKHAEMYIGDFSHVVEELKAASEEEVLVSPPFRMLAIALAEDGREEDALDICRQALKYGIEDGTKTGFKGRMKRLQKKIDRG
jgi:hypothetical protein